MIRINLLPQEERARRRNLPAFKIPQFGAVVPFVVLAGVGCLVATVAALQGREVAKLEAGIVEVRLEADQYKPQLEKIRLITQKRQEVRSRLDIVARLDRQRYFRVQLLDELSKSLPQNMWLSAMQELGERNYRIDGVTFSNFNVARFMQNLGKTKHWTAVDLSVAQQGAIEDLDVVQFSVTSGAQP
ncbi:MAG: PilN domain-containing protein [Candidatus Krumholzibacteriia bacterium]